MSSKIDTPEVAQWKQEQLIRQKMAQEIREHILDPLVLVSAFLNNDDSDYNPRQEEVSRLLALLVMGAHLELDMHCAYGGHFHPPFSDCLERELKEGAA